MFSKIFTHRLVNKDTNQLLVDFRPHGKRRVGKFDRVDEFRFYLPFLRLFEVPDQIPPIS